MILAHFVVEFCSDLAKMAEKQLSLFPGEKSRLFGPNKEFPRDTAKT